MAGQNLNGLKEVFVILIVYHHRFIKTDYVYVKICHNLMVKDTVVLVTTKVIILLVFVVVNTKMKKDYAVVEFLKTLILSVVMNVFVFHHTKETLGVIVVVLKLILTRFLLIPMVILYMVVVNATVLCREV
jgi:hypothetical protein